MVLFFLYFIPFSHHFTEFLCKKALLIGLFDVGCELLQKRCYSECCALRYTSI